MARLNSMFSQMRGDSYYFYSGARPDTWDSTTTVRKDLPSASYGNVERDFPRMGLRAMRCHHDHLQPYVRIDHTAGPGCFADNYGGVACVDCGKIMKEFPI